MGLQQRTVALFEALHAAAWCGQRMRYAGFPGYARRHREVIARFGRFPHRIAVLGRAGMAVLSGASRRGILSEGASAA